MSQPFTLYRSDSLGRASNCMYPHAVEVTDSASLAAAVSFDYVAVEYKNGYRKTNEENREVQTETLTVKARPLSTGYVKAKTGDSTTASVYNNWYKSVYQPADTPAVDEDAAAGGQG